jgi:hypothetical protein
LQPEGRRCQLSLDPQDIAKPIEGPPLDQDQVVHSCPEQGGLESGGGLIEGPPHEGHNAQVHDHPMFPFNVTEPSSQLENFLEHLLGRIKLALLQIENGQVVLVDSFKPGVFKNACFCDGLEVKRSSLSASAPVLGQVGEVHQDRGSNRVIPSGSDQFQGGTK